MQNEDIKQTIICHGNTQQVIDVILSDPDYYNSLMVEDELLIDYKQLRTRTTWIGLAALHDNDAVLGALLKAGVPADGLDMVLFERSLKEEHNYQSLNPKVLNHVVGGCWTFRPEVSNQYWSSYTCVYDREEELMLKLPWSTPFLLALLAGSHDSLSLLLQYDMFCDFRHPYYAKALELCENRSILLALSKVDRFHLKETTAECLTAFNEPLADILFQIGKKPKLSIITDLIMRIEGFANIGFGDNAYVINKESMMWRHYYKHRAMACLDFYRAKGYEGEGSYRGNWV